MEVRQRNDFSQRIVKKLEDYYSLKGIYPARLDVTRFNCSNQNQCHGDLARGMQCHVGYQYGDTIKVVVSAMDCGGGGGGWNGAHLKGTLYVPNAPTDIT